jgi:hypothetical protein
LQFFFTLCVICAAFVAAAAVVLSHVRFSMHKEKQVCSTLGAETLNRMKFSHEHEQGSEHEQSVRPALRLRNVCCRWRVGQKFSSSKRSRACGSNIEASSGSKIAHHCHHNIEGCGGRDGNRDAQKVEKLMQRGQLLRERQQE